jgi:ATP-dependent Lon protease
MDKTQREYLLRQQFKAIQQELGEKDEKSQEINELREKIKAAAMPEQVEVEADKQLRRLELMHPEAAEAAVIRTYLEWLVELPWSKVTADNLDIAAARQVLDEDHYDLDKVKDRILEYLSVRKLKERVKGPILCFVGPPGVGKTSLGKSIARALGRQFWRISLGGVRDEAEIRGHRRTYIGALPGRIIQGIRQAGSNNPVFMMDEIDKVGADFRGDPSAALLEVLDPEQNHAFSDHYLGVPFDLSNVMFMTTANLIDPVPPALLDRMEVIEIPGYTEEEKLKIARKYLIPRQLEENGVKEEQFNISDAAILKLISHYTREAGLRNLERELATVIRKVARGVAEGETTSAEVSDENLREYLGAAKFLPDAHFEPPSVGLATGLAWTPYGGEVLNVEASVVRGKGEVTVTGHLGEVMKESAQAARTFARSKILADETLAAGLKEKMKKLFRQAKLGDIDDFYQALDIHIHVPAGAIPKDGPSAGITMAAALVSALTDIPVRKDIAMTGEITLRGRVLPIGGLKEKSLAALRSGINNIIIPEKNEKDLEEIPENARGQLHFIMANHMDQVLEAALLKKEEGGKEVTA